MTKQVISEKILPGDLTKISESLGITTQSVTEKILKDDPEVIRVASDVIEDRLLAEIESKIKYGDYETIGQVLKISGNYVQKIFKRKTSKKHLIVVKMLRELIESRENMKARFYGATIEA